MSSMKDRCCREGYYLSYYLIDERPECTSMKLTAACVVKRRRPDLVLADPEEGLRVVVAEKRRI